MDPDWGGRIAQRVTYIGPTLGSYAKPHQCPPPVSPVSPGRLRYWIRSLGTSIQRPPTNICQRGAGIRGAAALTPAPTCSGDADVVRASQVQHAVEHVAGNLHLGCPTLIRMRAQPVADHLFPSANGSLGPGAFRVPGCPLPSHPALLGDELEVAVALRRIALGRLARHGSRARRHDDLRLGVALGDAGVNTVLVVRAIGRDGGHRPRHLVEQGTGLGAVIDVVGGRAVATIWPVSASTP